MKKIVFAFAIVALVGNVVGQKTKGQVSYDVFVSTDDPQASAYVDNMEGSILELYFGEGKVRTEMYMGDMMSTTSVSIDGNDTTLTLLDGMMGKIAMKTTLEDLDDEQRLAYTERDVELVEDETKEIAGYTCKKAIITTADEKESVVWYTEELVPAYRGGMYLFDEIPGVPLEMYSSWGKMDMKFVAFDYSKKLKKPEKLFSTEIPKGFTLRTAEEMKQMRGGGGK
jgi:GLPGLI family protein